jgi:two-component system NtrC family sensor kinase
MRIATYILTVFLFVLSSFVSNGQDKTIDSLKKVLQTQKEDTNRVNILNQLSFALANNNNLEEATEREDESILLAKKLNFKKGEGIAYANKSRIKYKEGDYPAALNNSQNALKIFNESGSKFERAEEFIWAGGMYQQQYNYEGASHYFDEALKIYQELKNNTGIGKSYTYIGGLQRWQEKFSESLKNFFAALKIQETTGNKIGIASVKMEIAYTYSDIGDYSESLKYLQAAFEIYLQMKDEFGTAICNKNIGDCYLKLSNYTEALSRCLTALKTLMKFGDQSWVASDYTSIGTIHEAMGAEQLQLGNKEKANKEFDEALKYYLLGLEINEKTKFNVDESQYNLGNIYTRLNSLREARNSFETGLLIAKEIHFKREIKNIYLGLSKVDSLEGNYKLAYEHFQKYILYRDSLGDENNSKALVELKLRYDFDKKDADAKTEQIKKDAEAKRIRNLQYTAIGAFLLIAVFLFWNNRQKQRSKTKIENAYTELKATQQQLIQSEKMASLGELTAGIAHEIQNPLNFVNNFSDLNKELVDELQQELKAGKINDAIAISSDIKDNEEKINHHGKRADAIVKGMLQHSRTSSGQKEPTDINALTDEYLRLAYHGLRAKDKSFNADIKTDFDTNIGKMNIIPQDIGRVVLNLINNAFYAVDEKRKQNQNGYEPAVIVSTKKEKDKIEIKVKDNGNGIPRKILDKIFQPFFTTKPTGQGTGLGLSLAYDIVTKGHGGELKVETREGEGSEFIIQLPTN